MYFLGIDGGGTSTEFILINELGEVLSDVKKPTAHYKQTSLENFEKTIKEGIEEVCKEEAIKIKDINYSVLGIPGYGEHEDEMHLLEGIVEEILGENHLIVNDAVVGWAGSLICQPGINIVAGTGSIGYGIDNYYESDRSGGWGPFCGDEGSAFWLGKKLLENYTKVADGRIEKNMLYENTKKELGIDKDFELLDIIIDEYKMERNKVAKLAKIITYSAEKGDKVSEEILDQAAYELSLLVKAIINKLDYKGSKEIPVSYSGGVFNAGDYILRPLYNYLKEIDERIIIREPGLEPILGAALYAYKLYTKEEINPKMIENLKEYELNKR